MARIDSKVLFMITSPRTPERMIPEIDLLQKNFSGQLWNTKTQKAFMEVLRTEDFHKGFLRFCIPMLSTEIFL